MQDPISIQISVHGNHEGDRYPIYAGGVCVAIAEILRYAGGTTGEIAGYQLDGKIYRTDEDAKYQVAQGIARNLAETAAREYARRNVTVTGAGLKPAEGLTVSQTLREIEAAARSSGLGWTNKITQAKIAAILKRAGLQDDTQAPADDIEADNGPDPLRYIEVITGSQFVQDQISGAFGILCTDYGLDPLRYVAVSGLLEDLTRYALRLAIAYYRDASGPQGANAILKFSGMVDKINATLKTLRNDYGAQGSDSEAYSTLADLCRAALGELKAPAE